MPQPLFEYEAKFIQDLKTGTGKGFQEWLAVIEASGLTEKLAIRDWLQKEHRLDYMPAHKLSFLFAEDQELNGPKVWFTTTGRCGEVGYEGKEGRFTMYWEMGGGDVLAIIDVPKPENWEASTKIPLEKRTAILDFIGGKTVEKQTYGKGSFKIGEDCILIYSG